MGLGSALIKPPQRNSAIPAAQPKEMRVPTWNGTPEQARFQEFSSLPNSVSQSEVEAMTQEATKLKENAKRIKEYATQAKVATTALTDIHKTRADYIQHIFKCVQEFQKADSEVYTKALDFREGMNEICDALGLDIAAFNGKQEARGGFDNAKQRWGAMR